MNDQLPTAGFWRRYTAYAVDSLLFALPVSVVMSPYDDWIDARTQALVTAAPNPEAGQALAAHLQLLDMGTGVILSQILMAIPLALCQASPWRATPGKKLFGLCVTDDQLGRLGFKRALARELYKVPALLLFGLGVLAVGWRADRRGWHDRLAGTLVLKRWPLARYQREH